MDTENSQNECEERPWTIERTSIDHNDYTTAAGEASSASPATEKAQKGPTNGFFLRDPTHI